MEKPLKEVAAVAVSVISDLNDAYNSGGFVGFVDEIGQKIPMIQGFTDAISGLAEKTKGMSSAELKDFGKTALVLTGIAPGLLGLGKAVGTVKTAVGGFNGIIDGTVGKIGKIPGTVKSVSSSLNNAGGMFKALGNALAIPFEGVGDRISSAFGKVSYRVGYYGAGIKNQLSKLASPISGAIGKFTAPFKDIGSAVMQGLGNVGTKISGYGSIIGNAFKPILAKAATFAPTFFKLINIGAGAAIIVAGMGLIYSQFGTQIDQLLLLVQTKGPEVITNFANGITAALPGLVAQGATLIMGILNAITVNLPALITAGVSIISTLASSLAAQLPQLIPCAVQMILTLVTSLISNLPQLITSGLNLMKGLASGIANSIPLVAAKAPVIIGKLASTIITNLPKILTAGVQIISKLAVGLVQGIPALIGKIPSMVSQIKNAFTSVNWGSVGMNIIKGIASGLTGAAGAIVEAAKSAANKALDAAKSALGIHSPSRVFRDQVGKMMALGMGIGFEKNIPIKSMNVGVQKAVSGLQKSVDLALSARTADKTIGRVKNYPGFDGGKDIDYDRLERIQMRAAEKMAKRPIYLGTKRIDEPLPKGAVPAL